MAPRTLSPTEKTKLAAASVAAIESGFISLAGNFSSSSWLGPNRYATDAQGVIHSEKRARTRHDPAELAEYVAASLPVHCLDGWGFLSGAVGELLNGDWQVALHLGYYAELRATTCLLGSMGIGTFNDYHIVLDDRKNYRTIGKFPTHKFVWQVIEWWAAQNDPFPLGKIRVSLAGVTDTIEDWIDDAAPGSTFAAFIAKEFLDSWSIDLKVLSDDHTLRNTVSYRPTRIITPTLLNARVICERMLDHWRACEPAAGSSFQVLDVELLRRSLEMVYNALPKPTSLADFVRIPLEKRRPSSEPEFDRELAVLSGTVASTATPIFTAAAIPGDATNPDGVLPVLARALLLLRLASAACAYHMQTAGFSESEVQFWWEPLGEDCGLWERLAPPTTLSDLWQDAAAAIAEIETKLSASSGPLSTWDLWSNAEDVQALHELGRFQKPGLWSLGLA